VYKSFELLPLGAVMVVDTPGIDDFGELGELRIKKTKQVLNKTDIAVLVVDSTQSLQPCDLELIELFKSKGVAYCVVYNKSDLLTEYKPLETNEIYVSALNGTNIHELKEKVAHLVPTDTMKLKLIGDLVQPNDFVVLVVPIDSSAPKGRLILPQQQTIRDLLEANAISVVTRETELKQTLETLGKKPALVVTDSQAFKKVSADTPEDIKLTSFSILMARYKGILDMAVRGVKGIDSLKDGDTVLISEGCSHHRQCEDIGTVKLPNWLKSYTKKSINFEFTSGTEFPEDLSKYSLVVHCGGCMLNEREVKYRMKSAEEQGVPITNYGIAIAYMNGILKRSIEVFPQLLEELNS
jgi:[FeFe] hydrogenase H-cluster maturation GTPase HydF